MTYTVHMDNGEKYDIPNFEGAPHNVWAAMRYILTSEAFLNVRGKKDKDKFAVVSVPHISAVTWEEDD